MLYGFLRFLLVAGAAIIAGWLALMLVLGLAALVARLRAAARPWAIAAIVLGAVAAAWAVSIGLRRERPALSEGPQPGERALRRPTATASPAPRAAPALSATQSSGLQSRLGTKAWWISSLAP